MDDGKAIHSRSVGQTSGKITLSDKNRSCDKTAKAKESKQVCVCVGHNNSVGSKVMIKAVLIIEASHNANLQQDKNWIVNKSLQDSIHILFVLN